MEPRIDNPESLTTEMIRQIGDDYLVKHATDFFQENRMSAVTLSCYNQPSSFLDKWLFLAENYKSLNSNNSNLAKTIMHLFDQAFHQEIIFSLKSSSPRVDYMTISRFGESFVNFTPLFVGEQMAGRIAEYALKHNVIRDQLPSDITTTKDSISEETQAKIRYANILKTFLNSQMQDSQMQDSKQPKFLLMKTYYEQLSQGELPDIQQMMAMTEQLKEKCIEHRDNGMKGLLKFTFLRQPKSYKTVCSLFDETNQLKC